MGVFSASTESELISLAKINANAFAELYRRYVKRIYNFFYYHTFNISDSEDLTSIVFEKALIHIRNVKTDTNFSAWIFKIAHNALIDFYRRNQKYQGQQNLDRVEIMVDADLENSIVKKEERTRLMKNLQNIQREYQEVLILKYQEELTNKEIGLVINKSEGAVKQLLRRSLKKMQEQLKEK